jgi:hypothetical protein
MVKLPETGSLLAQRRGKAVGTGMELDIIGGWELCSANRR